MIRLTLILIGISLFNLGLGQNIEDIHQFVCHQRVAKYHKIRKNSTTVFQGNKERKNYFEGWYFKMVSDNHSSIFSVIPGISLSEKGVDQHAFIQLINGVTAETYYFKFPIEQFYYSGSGFGIKIGDNYFSKDQLILSIHDDSTDIDCNIEMDQLSPLPMNKKIMGWYRKVPFMECYHGLVSMDHELTGSLCIGMKEYSFDNGRGYIEKDWGKSMPSSWIWMQSNSLSKKGNSFMLSVANIPWLSSSFTGFLGFLKINNKVQIFATYTKHHIRIEKFGDHTVALNIFNKDETIRIETNRTKSGSLAAPNNGSMDRRIAESVDAFLKITVLDKNGATTYIDSSYVAGLEIVGDIPSLIEGIKAK